MKVTSSIDFGWEKKSELPDWPLEAICIDVFLFCMLLEQGKREKLYSIYTVQGEKIFFSSKKKFLMILKQGNVLSSLNKSQSCNMLQDFKPPPPPNCSQILLGLFSKQHAHQHRPSQGKEKKIMNGLHLGFPVIKSFSQLLCKLDDMILKCWSVVEESFF
ncbi:UNVERIFIED_CONTAM: hypothetical protein K2H54_056579 [Gekko kuhli]